jgi:hypothetical protein
VNTIARAFQYIFLICAILLSYPFTERIFAADSYANAAHANAARELADKIMSTMEPSEEIGFSFQSFAPLGPKEIAAARQAIENELRARGLKFSKDSQTAAKIKVTLSESIQQFIWVAEIRRGQSNSLVMTTRARTTEKGNALQITIQTKPIYEQNDPILDIKLVGDDLLVLDSQRLALFRRQNDRWELARSAPLKNPHPFPRDIRGRLFDAGDAIQVRLPGFSCSGSIKPAFDLNCSQDESPWTFGFGGISPTLSKNYFVQENMPAFYSAAPVDDDGAELLAIAGIDGRTYLLDKASAKTGAINGWGSDIAAIASGCGTRRQILAALSTDPMERGVVQAFEIAHRKAVATSSAVEFPGPITALWPEPSQKAVMVVSRDIKTGRYAASYLSISCNR